MYTYILYKYAYKYLYVTCTVYSVWVQPIKQNLVLSRAYHHKGVIWNSNNKDTGAGKHWLIRVEIGQRCYNHEV